MFNHDFLSSATLCEVLSNSTARFRVRGKFLATPIGPIALFLGESSYGVLRTWDGLCLVEIEMRAHAGLPTRQDRHSMMRESVLFAGQPSLDEAADANF